MLKQRTAEGQSVGLVTVVQKSGKLIPCEITSAVFVDEDGIEKAITTIADISQRILNQKNIDTEKEKIVADDIVVAKIKQIEIDIKKEKIVAGNIILAKSKQKKIDIKKEKIVADDIALARYRQKEIDLRKEKIVGDNFKRAQSKSDTRLAEINEWIKYIGKTSYDVMWDWNKATGQIYVGDSIEEVFGYKVKNNTVNFTDFSRCLLPGEKDTVEEKLWKTLSSNSKSWEDSFMFKRKDGSFAVTTSRAKIIRDEEGNAIHLIGAIKDVSRLQELEKILLEQTTIRKEHDEVFQMAAKLSYDGIWDWNILTNEFFLGEGFHELFGYAIENTGGNMSEWNKHLHPDDKEAVEKGLKDAIASNDSRWEHAYRFVRADGSIANVFGRATIIRQADGKARRMIGVVHDLSRQKELEEKLDNEIATKGKLITEHIDSFKFIFNTSSDVFFDSDLVTNKVIISDAYEKDFGYEITNQMTPAEDWLSHVHPEDREALKQDYLRTLVSEDIEWKYDYRFLRADDSVAEVLSSCIILRNGAGKAYRVLGYMQDASKRKVLEEKLEQEIKLKEKQIEEATEDAREAERSDIGKELHDNVNQLLSASRLYLDMAKQGGETSEMYLSRSSEYTNTAIEEIRKLSKGLTTDTINDLGLCKAIENISRDTMEVNPVKIFLTLKGFDEHSVGNKFKLNVFRIVQEQLNNILKHAKATKVILSLTQIKRTIVLSISDNGVGFDTSQKQKGIGIVNVKSRAASYNGTADFVSRPGRGCILSVLFPITNPAITL